MSYQVRCPNCGHYLGSGHNQQSKDDGSASVSFSVIVEVPPAQTQHLRVPDPPAEPKENES